MCCIHLILTKFILVRYTNLFDFRFDKRRRYVKGMETKLEYLFDSGTTLNMLEIQKLKKKELVKWGFSFKNTLVNIEPTQHCCLGNDIFSVCLINQNLRNCPSSFFWSILGPNLLPENQNHCYRPTSLGISNNVSLRSQKNHIILVKLSNVIFRGGGGAMGSKMSPGPTSKCHHKFSLSL